MNYRYETDRIVEGRVQKVVMSTARDNRTAAQVLAGFRAIGLKICDLDNDEWGGEHTPTELQIAEAVTANEASPNAFDVVLTINNYDGVEAPETTCIELRAIDLAATHLKQQINTRLRALYGTTVSTDNFFVDSAIVTLKKYAG